MSDRHRASLISRMGAFGVKTRLITTDQEMVSVASAMFGVEGKTIDDVWQASIALGKKERARRARASRAREPLARYFGHVDWQSFASENEVLDAEREERIMIAKARSSIMRLLPGDPKRLAVEAFLRRRQWSSA